MSTKGAAALVMIPDPQAGQLVISECMHEFNLALHLVDQFLLP